MGKRPSFNPDILQQNRPSQSLKPLDFMRPMEEEATSEDTSSTEPTPTVEVAPAPRTNVRALERKSAGAVSAAAPVERQLYLPPVDTSEKPFNRGFHMYPSRHEQLGELAHYEKRKPWEVIEQALAEYVERHYGRQGRGERPVGKP
jgi:hypothetical protein